VAKAPFSAEIIAMKSGQLFRYAIMTIGMGVLAGCAGPGWREVDAYGRLWKVYPLEEVSIAVQVQDAAGTPLSGYRFAVLDRKVGNLTGYQEIEIGGSVIFLRPRSEPVIFSIEGRAEDGAVFPVYRQFQRSDLKRSLRLVFRFAVSS
jgi:hypothetical protein